MVILDLLGRRWTLRILWELRNDTVTFRELRTRCDEMSPSVLNERLGDLREAGIVELTDDGFRLTTHGADLMSALAPINEWAKRWAKREMRRPA